MSISMSDRRVVCCNAHVETEMIGNDGSNFFNIYANKNPNNPLFNATNKGEEDWGSGDSGEDVIVPIFSLNENNSVPNVRKEKREGSPPDEEDGSRKRVKFPPQHIKLLEEAFAEDQHPSLDTKEKLQQQLEVSENKIMVWFQNRRAKEKREIKKNQRIRQQRKQNNIKPPPYWPSDLSFDPPLRHIDPTERRGDNVQTPTTLETEEFEDNYLQNQVTRVPVLPMREDIPFVDGNPSCSYNNASHVIPLTNHAQYASASKDGIPMATTIKSLTIAQAPFTHHNSIAHTNTILLEPQQPWDESIYPIQGPSSCALANYMPIPTYSAQWIGSPNMQHFIPNNNYSNREYEHSRPSCKKSYTITRNDHY